MKVWPLFYVLSAYCFFLNGCSIEIKNNGIKEFAIYELYKNIEDVGISELKKELREDPTFTCEQYEKRLGQINSVIKNFPKGDLISTDNNVSIDNKGHLKIDIRGIQDTETSEYEVLRTKKNNPIQVFGSFNTNNARIGFEIEDTKVWIRGWSNGEFEFMVLYILRF